VTVFRPDKKDLRFEAELQAHPLYTEQWEPVCKWLGRFRQAATPAHYYELHHDLFTRFYRCQKFEDECRERERAIANDIRDAKTQASGREQLRRLSEELAAIKLARRVAGSVRAVYRDLGDALVWRLFRYQRPVIAALGQGKVVGRLSDEGLRTELDEIQWLWEEHGVFALHADITSCIRHGDVWAFHSLDPLRIYVTESKRSGNFNPDSPQGKRLKRLQELIKAGAHPEGAAGEALRFARSGVRYATYHAELRELLAEARRSTYAWREIDAGLALEVWDEANPARASREQNASRHATMRETLGWMDDLETITASAALRRIRSRQLDQNFASLAPLSLAPLALKDTTDLIFGRIDFITTLHASELERRLSTGGIRARVARGDEAAENFLRAERTPAAITVPALVREQVQVELMRLDTLTATVDWFLTDVAQSGVGPASADLFYEDEGAVWEAVP
jgi:hypothetical protein